jgi:hypothetical protein
MECRICKSDSATTCRVILGNIVVAQMNFCTSKCLRQGLSLVTAEIDKGVECLGKGIEQHISGKCNCIEGVEPLPEAEPVKNLVATCDVVSCHNTQEWDNSNIEYFECPEGWGSLILSDSKGELQTHYLCPGHVWRAWALLEPPTVSQDVSAFIKKYSVLNAQRSDGSWVRIVRCDVCNELTEENDEGHKHPGEPGSVYDASGNFIGVK